VFADYNIFRVFLLLGSVGVSRWIIKKVLLRLSIRILTGQRVLAALRQGSRRLGAVMGCHATLSLVVAVLVVSYIIQVSQLVSTLPLRLSDSASCVRASLSLGSFLRRGVI